MTLSDIVNNAATAVIMAPIALGLAERLQVNADSFLMAVAVGASCAFLYGVSARLRPGKAEFQSIWSGSKSGQLDLFQVRIPVWVSSNHL